MKASNKLSIFRVALLLFAGVFTFGFGPCLIAGPVEGPSARTQFQGFALEFGDIFINFESLAVGTALDTELNAQGVTFASVIQTDGSLIASPHNVYVSSAPPSQGKSIVGTPFPGGSDDGRVGYEIRFNAPQRRAGVLRIWNTNTITRFYSESSVLLAAIRGSQFVGFLAESENQADWIKRIQIDSLADIQGTRQVGYTDELYFGTTPTNRPILTLTQVQGRPMVTIISLAARQHRVEYVDALPAQPQSWLTLTNVTLQGTTATVEDTNTTLPAVRFYRAIMLPP